MIDREILLQITSEEVVSTFIARCKEVNPILNAIVENNYENALKEARTVDDFLNTTTRSIEYIAQEMPLLGVPITIKASIAVKGENIFNFVRLFTYVSTCLLIFTYLHT